MARLDPELKQRRREVIQLLDRRGLLVHRSNRAELERRCEAAFRQEWSGRASKDPGLVEAREALAEADSEQFGEHDGLRAGLQERMRALADPLDTLKAAGEEGVPHLAMVLLTDTWASILAIETLLDVPSGALRDQAITEGLFCGGDTVPDASIRVTCEWENRALGRNLEDVARRAAEVGVELHGLYWAEPFVGAVLEEGVADEIKPSFAKIAPLLYELGHHDALGKAFAMYLDPGWDDGHSVKRFLDEPCVQQAIEALRDAPAHEPITAPIKTSTAPA